MKLFIERYPRLKKHFMWSNPSMGVITVLPILIFIGYLLIDSRASLLQAFSGIMLGACYWTLFEYWVHRYIYHRSYKNRMLASLILSFHAYHHRNLKDQSVLNASWFPIILVAIFNFLLLFLLSLGSLNIFLWSIESLILCYLFYEYVHYSIHVRPNANSYIRWITKYHLYHHYVNPKTNFANTTAFWDIIFGTYNEGYKRWGGPVE